ncbi:MAG: MBOAT family O-acyltransferase [Hyphomicrobiaceae bacterium]|nr:MBOAT family O-acyltransferase [Hyphomicrobiaceae bacterium]
MIFTNFDFLVFLSVLLPTYWLIAGARLRKGLLVVASLYFYGYWDFRFVPLLVAVALIAWAAAREWPQWPMRRATLVAVAVGVLLGVLGLFKYTGFLADTLTSLAALAGFSADTLWRPSLILPVGISFFTFQAISYLVDVRRGHVASHGFVDVLLYLSLFPQLVAGPIVRAADFFPQLASARRFVAAEIVEGCRLFLLGLVYKAVLADNIARLIDPVWRDVATASSADLVAAAVGFYAQIYFDFNGYSLMAIGVAAMFGFLIPANFDYPYAAVSLTDFWRRWHMSLSQWLRDYLYIPLGGSRGGALLAYRNVMLTMLLGGLWHGASWNFVLWGGLHGLGLCIERAWRQAVGRLGQDGTESAFLASVALAGLGWLWTQGIVLALWVPFRAATTSDAITVLSALAGQHEGGGPALLPGWLVPGLMAVLAADVLAGRWRQRSGRDAVIGNPVVVALVLAAMLALVALFISLEVQPFIYFQF